MNLDNTGKTPDTQTYVPLMYCVNQVLLELEDYSGKQVERYLGIAIIGYQELNFTTINSVKVEYLTMSDLNEVKLPTDFIDYVKVGIPVNGRIWNLGIDDNLLLPRGISCGNDARDLFINSGLTTPDYGFYYTDHYRDGQYVGGLYGIGGGFREAYYRIDKERGMISFDSPIPQSQIVLEYKSSGISAQTLVPRKAITAIMDYIHWRRNIRKAASVWGPHKQNFVEAEKLLNSLENQFDIQEYLDMMYETTYQTAKR